MKNPSVNGREFDVDWCAHQTMRLTQAYQRNHKPMHQQAKSHTTAACLIEGFVACRHCLNSLENSFHKKTLGCRVLYKMTKNTKNQTQPSLRFSPYQSHGFSHWPVKTATTCICPTSPSMKRTPDDCVNTSKLWLRVLNSNA